jgi:CRP-like cAMP-binding protein
VEYDNFDSNRIFKSLTFNQEEIKIIESVFHKVEVKKGATLLNTGDTTAFKYYIIEGCLRSYHVNSKGKEFTIQFAINDWWMTDFTAFFSSEKSIMTIEAIKNSTLYKISKTDEDYLYDKIPKLDRFFRVKVEKAYATFQKRILANLSQTAKERYSNFIKTYPNIEKSIKNYHIASYLGITNESLSRIRKELSNS